eukprot:g8210.t1
MAARDEVVLQNALPEVERALGYSFRDRRLLLTALTHRSFCNETDTASGDFDELEWLGDSVLQLAISSWLFRSAKGSRRSSGQLSATRQRFVDAGACESFAVKLNLLPFLRIGHGQPVRGTKILADCFEAVLGAVYVDAGGCSDLEPIHAILARVIPSYEQGAPEPAKPRAEEPRKLMNLAHRLAQMAKRGPQGANSGGGSSVSPAAESSQRSPSEVLREFDERLRGFQHDVLRGGSLSFGSRVFAEAFGETVRQFFAAVATGSPEMCARLDSVLDGSSMLRKHFADAPPGSERVVMEVQPVPSELRLQIFTVVEFLQANVLHQQGGSGGSAESAGANPVLQLIRSTPQGEATITLLSSIAQRAIVDPPAGDSHRPRRTVIAHRGVSVPRLREVRCHGAERGHVVEAEGVEGQGAWGGEAVD